MTQIIKKMIAEQLGVEESQIEYETELDELGADSLDVAELLVKFEDEFGIYIPDDDVIAMRTFGDVAEYAENLHNAN
jgi:acyl carrier protein